MKLNPVDFESSPKDKFHYAVSAAAMLCSGLLLLLAVTGPAIAVSVIFANDEHRSHEPPRQFLLFLSPAFFAAFIVASGIVFNVPGPPYFTTTNSDFIKGIPFTLFYAGALWLLVIPWLLVAQKWRAILLAVLWIPTLFTIAVVATMSITGVWL